MARTEDASQIRQNYIWNTLGSLANALASVMLLMVATRCLGAGGAGVFSLAYALGQQFQIVGAFEMRPYQATDVRGRYSFSVYLGSRILTTSIMVFAIVAYGFAMYGIGRDLLILTCVCGLRILDVAEDVFQGALQRVGRLDIAGKALFLRVVVTTVVFCAGLVATHDIVMSCLFSFVVSLPVLYALNVKRATAWVKPTPSFEMADIKSLIFACAPLFAGSFLQSDLTNVPRLAIHNVLSTDMQTIYSALFMPAFVINLLSGFLFKPMLTTMAESWEEHEHCGFASIICRCEALVASATVVCCAGAFVVGIPVLSFLYGIDLSGYRPFLIVIMIGGGLNAANIVMYYALVTMRRQRVIMGAYVLADLVSRFISSRIVCTFGMTGAAYAYALSMLVIFSIYAVDVLRGISGITSRHSDEG